MRTGLWVTAVLVLALASVGASLGVGSERSRTATVRGAELESEAFASVVRVPREGVAEVRPRVSGTVISVAVREGDRVRAGQILALIEVPGAQSEVQKRIAERNEVVAKLASLGQGNADTERVLAARAQALQTELAAANAKAARQQQLHELGSVSDAEAEQTRLAAEAARERYNAMLADSRLTLGVQRRFDLRAARERLSAAEAALEQARVALGLGEVTSAITGVVLSRRINPGDVISAGAGESPPSFEVADCTDTMLRGELDEIDGQRVRVGLPVDVYKLGGTARVASGYVRYQGARLERRTLGFADPRESLVRPIWLAVDWTRESGGATGPIGERFEARIQLPAKPVDAAVPRSALTIRDGVASVQVMWGPFWRSVPVRLAQTDRQLAEIVGLAVGTRVRLQD